jgi:hypothetical protein
MKLSTTTFLLAFFVSFAAAAPHAASISDSSPAFLERRTKTTDSFNTWYYGDSGPGQQDIRMVDDKTLAHPEDDKTLAHPCVGKSVDYCEGLYDSAMEYMEVVCSLLKGKRYNVSQLKAFDANFALFEIETVCIE